MDVEDFRKRNECVVIVRIAMRLQLWYSRGIYDFVNNSHAFFAYLFEILFYLIFSCSARNS